MEIMDWNLVLQSSDPRNNYLSGSADSSVPPLQAPTPLSPVDNRQKSQGIFDLPAGLSVSTAFPAQARWHALAPDIAFTTTDSVLFYVHSHIILAASENRFGFLIPPPSMQQSTDPVIRVLETSSILNIILHLVYNMPCEQYSPPFKTLSDAVDRLSSYGIHPKAHIVARSPLYNLLLSYAPTLPIEVYTLAAKHDLLELATLTSPHLLSFDLSKLNDGMVEAMGPVYLRKLFFLHVGRCDALKRLLLQPPQPHSPIPTCTMQQQNYLTRAWALATARLVWDVRPDMSVGLLESSLLPLANDVVCESCKESLRERVKNLAEQWSQIKVGYILVSMILTCEPRR
ncbi:hypothetical protein GYMLUDRAFT_490373 [Collybiopsis luxurians FD-317 M1]|uniref:BTB domain-containing protein n=1 Tax=Collybiopsis luxurians FD-317 M1 TaxID=944289 RepID=A0A0D0CJ40_9AGAR|nr:hypothetical protein GYMLUDRAFT_490373 [Collybiopsis luxurians FD-317 M1]